MNKKLMSLALGAAFCAGTFASSGMAFAQDASQAPAQEAPAPAAAPEHGGHRQMDPEKQLANMTKRLNLTADQQNQIRPILTDRQQQMATLRADTSLAGRPHQQDEVNPGR
jgi:Spy/CpxP family protein refolding chaperone